MIHSPFDTSSEIEKVRIDLLRRTPGWRKSDMVGQMTSAVLALAKSGLKMRYPHATEVQLHRLLADLVLGPDPAARSLGPAKIEH